LPPRFYVETPAAGEAAGVSLCAEAGGEGLARNARLPIAIELHFEPRRIELALARAGPRQHLVKRQIAELQPSERLPDSGACIVILAIILDRMFRAPGEGERS